MNQKSPPSPNTKTFLPLLNVPGHGVAIEPKALGKRYSTAKIHCIISDRGDWTPNKIEDGRKNSRKARCLKIFIESFDS